MINLTGSVGSTHGYLTNSHPRNEDHEIKLEHLNNLSYILKFIKHSYEKN